MDTILVVILVLEIFLISFVEYKYFNGILTPIHLLGLPFIVVLLLAITASPLLGFKELNYAVVPLWITGIITFWAGGLIAAALLGKTGDLNSFTRKRDSYLTNTKVTLSIKILSLLLIFILLFFLRDFNATDISSYNEDNTEFLLGGIPGHTKLLLTFLVIGLMIDQRGIDIFFIFIILCFIYIQVLARVKAWLFLPFISAGIGRYIVGKFKFSLSKIALILGSSFLVFYVFFYLSIAGNNKTMEVSVASNFFMSYFFSGILGMSEHTKKNLPIGFAPEKPFAIFYNIPYKITGKKLVSPGNSYFVKTHKGGVLQSNTRTFFGQPYMFGGYPILLFYALFWGFISYLIMFICYLKLDNIWLLSLYSYYLAGLFFGWFGPYFTTPSFIEVPILAFIIYNISKIKNPLFAN